jgi:hypothetical protein
VEDIMKKRSNLLGCIAVATVFLSASPASAQQAVPVYNSTFFSDATQQTPVGYKKWSGCDHFDQPLFELEGSYSQYEMSYFVGYCYYGQMVLGWSPPE